MSPVSPFVLQEMQRKPDDDEDDGNDQLRDRWGFAPGADDTLDVSYGREMCVRGRTTMLRAACRLPARPLTPDSEASDADVAMRCVTGHAMGGSARQRLTQACAALRCAVQATR